MGRKLQLDSAIAADIQTVNADSYKGRKAAAYCNALQQNAEREKGVAARRLL